jgi:ADP-ribose pyrophosphatase
MHVLEDRVLHEDRWIRLLERRYRDELGHEGRWSYVERRGNQQAAVIVARTAHSDSLVLIEQFRLPFARAVLEFPAGLIDPGENPEAAARRELLEETGYAGEILAVSPAVSSTAGLTTETEYLVYMRVGEAPVQSPRPEGAERIRVLLLEPGGFASFLEECAREGRLLDAKLYVYLRERSLSAGPGSLSAQGGNP